MLIFGALMVVALAGGYGWYVLRNTARVSNPELPAVTTTTIESENIFDTATAQDDPSEAVPIQQKPLFDTVVLQGTLDTWNAETPGTKGVVVMSTDGSVLASLNPDRPFFAASIYKLYVAYFGYIQVDTATVDPKQQYINGHTRSECLDLMIRESDSPCAEKLWAEIGKSTLTDKLKAMGINTTSMTNISTTVRDSALMMATIARGEGLTPASQATFLQSAREQIYRDALNKGFSSALTVYNKIGFNGLVEYHDVAIVELQDGRKFVLAVLSENTGTKNIAELGRRVEAILQL